MFQGAAEPSNSAGCHLSRTAVLAGRGTPGAGALCAWVEGIEPPV